MHEDDRSTQQITEMKIIAWWSKKNNKRNKLITTNKK